MTCSFIFLVGLSSYDVCPHTLQARVADAERRLLALRQNARQRRRDKRELAALHQALAEQEGKESTGSCGGKSKAGRGDDGAERADGAGGAGGRGEGTVDGLARAGDGRLGSPCAGGKSSAPRVSPPPEADSSAIETNTDEASAVLAARAFDGALATQTSRSATRHDPDAVPREAATPPWDRSSDTDDACLTQSDNTLCRRALLVRLGFLRARLEAGGTEGEEGGGLRPVAESLRREVEELAKSGAAATRGRQ